MSIIRLLFVTNSKPVSVLLRIATWSHWSHVASIMEDGVSVIDATMLHGVSHRPIEEAIQDSDHEIREYECVEPEKFYAFLRAQLGKGYDFPGVFGIGLHRDWQEADKWFCSELVAAALDAGGSPRFSEDKWRVTPQNLWMAR